MIIFFHKRVYLKQVGSETTLSWAIPLYDMDFFLNGFYFVNKEKKRILYVPNNCSGWFWTPNLTMEGIHFPKL